MEKRLRGVKWTKVTNRARKKPDRRKKKKKGVESVCQQHKERFYQHALMCGHDVHLLKVKKNGRNVEMLQRENRDLSLK